MHLFLIASSCISVSDNESVLFYGGLKVDKSTGVGSTALCGGKVVVVVMRVGLAMCTHVRQTLQVNCVPVKVVLPEQTMSDKCSCSAKIKFGLCDRTATSVASVVGDFLAKCADGLGAEGERQLKDGCIPPGNPINFIFKV
ncbi:unnamed protein product [Hydatigera taeniaeformis]|uniref:Uncharacterized protein n=1 Tax=Hydatigena taeniaeformis TaxID=6205 RepID=A0A3P7G6A3_HYDTA|nr:unnamed protein product [Hydatigera taeniaeformis]